MNSLLVTIEARLAQREECLCCLRRVKRLVAPGDGAIWNRQKRLTRQLVLMSNRSFNFIKGGRKLLVNAEGSNWNDLRQALERKLGDSGVSLLEEEDDLFLYGMAGALAEKPLLILSKCPVDRMQCL